MYDVNGSKRLIGQKSEGQVAVPKSRPRHIDLVAVTGSYSVRGAHFNDGSVNWSTRADEPKCRTRCRSEEILVQDAIGQPARGR